VPWSFWLPAAELVAALWSLAPVPAAPEVEPAVPPAVWAEAQLAAPRRRQTVEITNRVLFCMVFMGTMGRGVDGRWGTKFERSSSRMRGPSLPSGPAPRSPSEPRRRRGGSPHPLPASSLSDNAGWRFAIAWASCRVVKSNSLRPGSSSFDAVVVGSGPNGLAAGITLARAGHSVVILEAKAEIGGGARSAALTLPGFVHDVCSAVHPLAVASPFFRTLPLAEHGVRWIESPAPLAHPLDDGTAVMLERSIAATEDRLGGDGPAYRRLFEPLVVAWKPLADELLAPLHWPHHPGALARFGWAGIRSARGLAESRFAEERARALFAGLAAHSVLPLESPGSAAFGLVLALFGHAVGWPLPEGGSQKLSDGLAAYFRSLGGVIRTESPVSSLRELPPAKVVLLEVTPRQLNALEGGEKNPRQARLEKFRYGPGAFKVDWALAGPIPWRAPECARAATVHVGGTLAEIAGAEAAVAHGETPDRPFVLVAQPSLFDRTRAPTGRETAWAYCHVPNGSAVSPLAAIESQIERFAPGFRDLILARHSASPAQLEAYNPNYIGGDISGGANDLGQLFTRPLAQPVPYASGLDGVYLCSASTPPGGGVHGMCGYYAAQAALRRELKRG
jgi:phytoene dehydrogenase-like protein